MAETIQQCFRKWIQEVQKNILVVFSSKKYWFHRTPNKFFSQFELNKFSTDLNGSEYLCKWTIWQVFATETFFYSCTSSRKISDFKQFFAGKVLSFSLFLSRRSFGSFSQKNRLFMNCWLNSASFGRKVFNSVFKSTFKMWKRTFLFFLDTQFFSLGTWESFVEHWAKNSALFPTQQNSCAEEQFAVFSQRKCFSFLYFGREIFQTLRKTSPKKYSVFHFLCSEDILVLFTRDLIFFWTWL